MISTKNLQDLQKLELKYGIRFSVIAFLSFYDTIGMRATDPMYNLFLGTAKHIFKIWKNLGYLNKNKLDLLQKKTGQFVVPHDII